MNWVVRAVCIAIFAFALYVSFWCYENYYFLLFVKRLISIYDPQQQGDAKSIIDNQPSSVTVSPIIIAVPPKQGTTWLGHICFQLRARGAAMGERNLMLDMPYVEAPKMLLGNLSEWRNISGNLEPPLWELSKIEPHLIRTHLELSELREAGAFPKYRVVTLFRDPIDALVSAWRFIPSLVYVSHELIDPNLFAQMILWTKYDAILQNMVDYWEQRDNSNVLILFFDDLKDDLRRTVRTVAEFMALSPALTEEELLAVEAQSTLSAMAGQKRFEIDLGVDAILKTLGLSEKDVIQHKDLLVRSGGGRKGDGKSILSDHVQQKCKQRWDAIVATKTGMQNFSHYVGKLRSARKVKSG